MLHSMNGDHGAATSHGVFRAQRLHIQEPEKLEQFGLLLPSGKVLWSWLTEAEARSSLHYVKYPGTHVLRRNWFVTTTDLDQNNEENWEI